MSSYITAEDFKQSAELKGTTYADRDIERAISAASRAIDDICQRRFDQDATEAVRYYRAVTRSLCWIDDLMLPLDDLTEPTPWAVAISRTSVDASYSEAWVEGTDYQLEPLNAAADGKPYEMLRALKTQFPAHAGGVRVTARFGWQEIPAQVVEAAVILSTKLLVRARQAPFGIVVAGIDAGVAMRIGRSDPDVSMLLSDLTREAVF